MHNAELEQEFTEFWNIYPRRIARLAAMKAYARARKSASKDKIHAAAKRYAAERANQDKTFTKHAATWLNAGCWDDYEPEIKPTMPIDSMIGIYLSFTEREPWDEYGRRTGKSWPRDSKGGWWFPCRLPPDEWKAR